MTEKIDNNENTGHIRVGQDDWRATSETGEVIPEGTRIIVNRIDGTHAVVTTINEEA